MEESGESEEIDMIDFSEGTCRSVDCSWTSNSSSASKRAMIGFQSSFEEEQSPLKLSRAESELPRTSTPKSRLRLVGFDDSCERSFDASSSFGQPTNSTKRHIQFDFDIEDSVEQLPPLEDSAHSKTNEEELSRNEQIELHQEKGMPVWITKFI